MSFLFFFRISFGAVGTYKWLVVRGFVTWGGILLVWNLGNFNSAVCDALVGCQYMYFGYGTCTVIPICFNVFGHWGFCVFATWGRVCQNFGCGAFIYGVVPVTVTTITWSGACVRLNFSPKRRVLWALNYGYTYFLLVGHGCGLLLGCDMTFVFFWAGLCGLKGVS